MTKPSMLETAFRRERWVVTACLLLLAALAWAYLWAGAGMDTSMPGMVMAPMVWTPATALITFAMWWVMMIAMMVPSALPAVLLFTAIDRKQATAIRPAVGAGVFVAGYLAIWGGFSVLATALQWGLERLGLMAMDMALSNRLVAGGVLVAAGLYQLSPLKTVCLRHCQSPIELLSRHWRAGARGAFRMGLVHGAHCLGCCWALMGLLFVGGIMNLVWIVGIALYVGIEKLMLGASWMSRGGGLAMIAAGLALAVRAI